MKGNVLKLLLTTYTHIQFSIGSKIVDRKYCNHVFWQMIGFTNCILIDLNISKISTLAKSYQCVCYSKFFTSHICSNEGVWPQHQIALLFTMPKNIKFQLWKNKHRTPIAFNIHCKRNYHCIFFILKGMATAIWIRVIWILWVT